jgi:hypothetical protein
VQRQIQDWKNETHEGTAQSREDLAPRHDPDRVQAVLGMSHHERLLHTGFANYWYAGEWFNFEGDDDARDLLLEAL